MKKLVNINSVYCKECNTTYPIEYNNCPSCDRENPCNHA